MNNSAQLFLTSMHCLWMYDYLLTVGDEVQYPCISFNQVSDSDRCVDKVRLVRKEILE